MSPEFAGVSLTCRASYQPELLKKKTGVLFIETESRLTTLIINRRGSLEILGEIEGKDESFSL